MWQAEGPCRRRPSLVGEKEPRGTLCRKLELMKGHRHLGWGASPAVAPGRA